MIKLTEHQLDSNSHWDKPIGKMLYIPLAEDLDLFDQNGYDLTVLEQHFAATNDRKTEQHRKHRTALKTPWFTQNTTINGPHLNHSLLFERKGYSGAALQQLTDWATKLPLIHKLIALRPKWGLDFSMDYVDSLGNSFELLHWEWDSFDYDEIVAVKQTIEPTLLSIDWTDAAQQILKNKDKWHHLDFFSQSRWKCDFFGIPEERFKMVAWQ